MLADQMSNPMSERTRFAAACLPPLAEDPHDDRQPVVGRR